MTEVPSPRGAGRAAVARAARVLLTLALLALVLAAVDLRDVGARLTGARPGWLVAAVALTAVDHVLSALRWRFTARRLGLELPPGEALREVYLGMFLNQVLPGGVAGDAARAVRHGTRQQGERRLGAATSAVALERGAGQLALGVVVTAGLVAWPALVDRPRPALPDLGDDFAWGGAAGVALGAVVVAALAALAWMARGPLARATRSAGPHLRRAFVERGAAPVQAALSLGLVLTYVASFALAARAVGVALDPGAALALLPLCLLAMTLPLTVGGWGAREGAAAALFPCAGLAASDGVAASVAYGLVVLVGALPGAAFSARGRGRRARPRP